MSRELAGDGLHLVGTMGNCVTPMLADVREQADLIGMCSRFNQFQPYWRRPATLSKSLRRKDINSRWRREDH